MIVFEIKRVKEVVNALTPLHPKAEGLFTRTKRAAGTDVRPLQQLNPPLERPNMPGVGMGKLGYVRWLNAYVYPHFPKGSKVTLKSQAYVPGKPPAVWFEVGEIQELHYAVQYDRESGQPKAVGIRHIMSEVQTDFPIYYPPALLRRLNSEEEKLIDSLRNQESGGRDVEGEAANEPVSNDTYTG